MSMRRHTEEKSTDVCNIFDYHKEEAINRDGKVYAFRGAVSANGATTGGIDALTFWFNGISPGGW